MNNAQMKYGVASTIPVLPPVRDIPDDPNKRALMQLVDESVWDCAKQLADEGYTPDRVCLGADIIAKYEHAAEAKIDSLIGLPVQEHPMGEGFVSVWALESSNAEPVAVDFQS
ncbi:hypothetical protein V5738_10925 [Salinisphaera sp. SPP-AMP-43]|uniref:hypothetical protein n=1 Tax=Salinisphaera sp. SPP-AMP-43 TaxID=3121288 RepID=UPI003C6DCA34